MSRILVADDDRVVLFGLAEGLRGAGFDVIEARDGDEALALCRSQAPDLAMLDIRMPGLDGLELAKALREQTSVPFLFLSAYSDVELVKRAVAIGALGYLVKPLDVGAIVPSLRTALARAADLAGLRYALESNRTIATAVGVLMARENSDQQAAVERLRALARNQRRRMEDVARKLVDDEDLGKP